MKATLSRVSFSALLAAPLTKKGQTRKNIQHPFDVLKAVHIIRCATPAAIRARLPDQDLSANNLQEL